MGSLVYSIDSEGKLNSSLGLTREAWSVIGINKGSLAKGLTREAYHGDYMGSLVYLRDSQGLNLS